MIRRNFLKGLASVVAWFGLGGTSRVSAMSWNRLAGELHSHPMYLDYLRFVQTPWHERMSPTMFIQGSDFKTLRDLADKLYSQRPDLYREDGGPLHGQEPGVDDAEIWRERVARDGYISLREEFWRVVIRAKAENPGWTLQRALIKQIEDNKAYCDRLIAEQKGEST